MRHQIKLEDFESWLNDNPIILYASSSKESKRLFASANGTLEVHSKGKVVWEGTDKEKAIEEYNNL